MRPEGHRATTARARAENTFVKNRPEEEVMNSRAKTQKAEQDKVARLRALRLAKEAEDRAEAERVAAEKAARKTAKPRKKAAAKTGS